MDSFVLKVGYKRHTPESMRFRNPRDVAEAVTWCNMHAHIWFRANDGTARQCKINGAVRTWKRDADRIEIPIKYGMYEYGIFTQHDIGRILIPV